MNEVNYIEILKKARKEKKLTQSALAQKLGIGLRMYQKIESGKLPKFKRDHTENLDRILGTQLYELIHNTNNPILENLMEVGYLTAYTYPAYIHVYAKEKQKADTTLNKLWIAKEHEQGLYMVIEVAGDSMDDGTKKAVCDGDKLLIKELDKTYWEHNKLNYTEYIFVLFTKTMGIICTQIIKHHTEKQSFTCQFKNQLYKSVDITTKEIYRLFYVKKIVERKVRL